NSSSTGAAMPCRATNKVFSWAARCSITSSRTCAYTKKRCSARFWPACASPTLHPRWIWSTAMSSATACPATRATATSRVNSADACNAAWWGSMCPFPCPWPGIASAAGKNRCSATCTYMARKGCASTRSKKASCSAGRKAPRRARSSPCRRPSRAQDEPQALQAFSRRPRAVRRAGAHAVSHDREFLNNVVTQTLAFEGDGRWGEHAGGYDAPCNRPGALSGRRRFPQYGGKRLCDPIHVLVVEPRNADAARLDDVHAVRLDEPVHVGRQHRGVAEHAALCRQEAPVIIGMMEHQPLMQAVA